jgi:hypothetical protein
VDALNAETLRSGEKEKIAQGRTDPLQTAKLTVNTSNQHFTFYQRPQISSVLIEPGDFRGRELTKKYFKSPIRFYFCPTPNASLSFRRLNVFDSKADIVPFSKIPNSRKIAYTSCNASIL